MTTRKKRAAAPVPTPEDMCNLAAIPDKWLLDEITRRLNAEKLSEMLVREAVWNHLQPSTRDLKVAAMDAGGAFHSDDELAALLIDATELAMRENPLTCEVARMAYGADEFNASTLRGLLADRGIFHAYS